jgi:hypothetical protein
VAEPSTFANYFVPPRDVARAMPPTGSRTLR